MKVEFVCEREPQLAQYCQEMFGKKFDEMLAAKELAPSIMLRKFTTVIRREARRQEWFDFTVDNNGRRHVIRDSSHVLSRPRLLVPVIRIVEDV